MEHEKEIIRLLVKNNIPREVLDAWLACSECEINHTGVGYFIKAASSYTPLLRTVFDKPLIVGTSGNIKTGYLVFVEDGELTLECHTWESDQLSPGYRNGSVTLKVDQ